MTQPLTQTSNVAFAPEDHFPTAQWVAAMRAYDTKCNNPRIGSNVGGGPDLAAPVFAGALGTSFLADSAAAVHAPVARVADTMIRRTMYFDQQWMTAYASGCRQFVILAAGLDARAWRLPMNMSSTVFEVDIPAAFAYKDEKVQSLVSTYPQYASPPCNRVCVPADLAESGWAQKLINAGFDPSKRSFFLVEGLLMYLPSDAAVQGLFNNIGALMCRGSMLAGDGLVNYLGRYVHRKVRPVLEKYGTGWTHDMPSTDALVQILCSASLPVTEGPEDLNGVARKCRCFTACGMKCFSFQHVVYVATKNDAATMSPGAV